MSGLTTADSDAEESRAARDRPLPHQREHVLDCQCPEHRYDGYTPGDGS